MDIKWQEPPPRRRGNGGGRPKVWEPLADELKKNPGQWALVREGVRTRHLGNDQCRELGLQRSVRKREDGTFDIYARYEEKP